MDLMTPNSGLFIWQFSGLFFLGIWSFALFDSFKSDFGEPNQKLNWLILTWIAPVIGAFLYFSMRKNSKNERTLQPIFNRVNLHKS